MAWYEEAIFYHIYPLGLTDAPKENRYGEPVHRLNTLLPWIDHIHELGCNALYIGPLFESVGHGYETTDYYKVDSRLGTNEDLIAFVTACHEKGIRVILDGVFNHTGRDFFAFRDLQQNRENSRYRDWYCRVDFRGNNSYNDGFSYENWGGHDLLVKLNQRNPEVVEYIQNVIRFWVREFDIDGLRLDAADVMDFEYMKAMRRVANEVKADFWLMGEVIHGDYSRWMNGEMLHSVTNYVLHKALYSGHNDHNYFEVAHTIKYVANQLGDYRRLYTFADNHDVERIASKLKNKAHLVPTYILLYTLPGVPSLYYGSEFAIEGRKERFSDYSLRPALDLNDFSNCVKENRITLLIALLGQLHQNNPALSYGSYRELLLRTGQFVFAREWNGESVVVAVNNEDHDVEVTVPAGNHAAYAGALFGGQASVANGMVSAVIPANSGEVWVAADRIDQTTAPLEQIKTTPIPKSAFEDPKESKIEETPAPLPVKETVAEKPVEASVVSKPYEEMTVEELQEAILACMRKNGPVTDYMLGTVRENTHHGSLLNWVRSFR